MTGYKEDAKAHEHAADKPEKVPATPPEPVFVGRSGALAVALRARNVPVIAAADAGDAGVKLTVETAAGPVVYDLEGLETGLEVALAIFRQKGVI